MSLGLGRSYQHVGLNRLGAYLSVSRDKGPSADKNVCATTKGPSADKNVCATTKGPSADKNVCATTEGPSADKSVCATTERPNEIWRRVTGIYPGVKQSAKERKRGLKLLARRLEERLERARENPQMEREEVLLSFAGDFKIGHEAWTRVQTGGISIEAVCIELGCTRERLTLLLKEYCGLTAGEFFDAQNFSAVRRLLADRMRAAAHELWGYPGSFMAVKLMNGGLSQRREGAKNGRGKESKYFRTRPEELFEESRADERNRRIGELCAMLRADFDLESWAVSAGYACGAKLNRACLTVSGRSLAQIERLLAIEVVQFYLCAEDLELREIACSDAPSVEVARARELYHGDDAKPEAPFEDEWAKFEELKAEWLSKLREILT